jgi:hypothetical protein
MLLRFFAELRSAKLPVSLKEYLLLLEALDGGVIAPEVEQFYHLARAALIKDERHLDRFDQVFGHVFRGLERIAPEAEARALPEEWLRKLAERYLTEAEKAEIEALGGFEALLRTLAERLAEQKERHQGGSKWIGTAGTSPFGGYGYNPEGVRIGQGESRHRRAVKVWDKREFRNLDDQAEIGVRTLQLALRSLRRFAREGAAEEFDLDATIGATARQGYLDVILRPERRNAVKVLLFLDVGGSMDPHVAECERLFTAARSEFKRLEHFYFHNCLYEAVWKDNRRRHADKIATWDVLHTFPRDYKVIIVGDASMSPYEISYPGGAVEHWNEEAGGVWLGRLAERFPALAWLNPVPRAHWDHAASIQLVRQIIGAERMFPLTLAGIEAAAKALAH